MRRAIQERLGRNDQSRRAIAALDRACIGKGGLYRMRFCTRSQTRRGCDLRPVGLRGQDDLGLKGSLLKKILEEIPEHEVLSLLPETADSLRTLASFSQADIAQHLFLSEGTVRNYTSAIFAKLGVADRTQAAVVALRYGLVDTSPR